RASRAALLLVHEFVSVVGGGLDVSSLRVTRRTFKHVFEETLDV
ncbi:hypothetical protein Q604_UNBC00250G0002, partial [human gut metagenome]